MNKLPAWLALGLLLAGCKSAHQPPETRLTTPTVVEVACGECKFAMKGEDCDLAVRVNGHSYFVDGVNPKSLGDPHASDGICETIRKARVTGQIKDGHFVTATFELLPAQNP